MIMNIRLGISVAEGLSASGRASVSRRRREELSRHTSRVRATNFMTESLSEWGFV